VAIERREQSFQSHLLRKTMKSYSVRAQHQIYAARPVNKESSSRVPRDKFVSQAGGGHGRLRSLR